MRGLLLCGVLLAAPGLVSCGGDDASGDHETRGDAALSGARFCAGAEKFENTFKETNTADLPAGLPALRDAAQELKDLGTPTDLPDSARKGLVLTLDRLIALPDDSKESDLMTVLDLTGDEKAESTAFEDYLDHNCDYRTKDGS